MTDTSKFIKISARMEPAIEPGQHTLSVTHTTETSKETEGQHTYESELKFYVAGNRFHLNQNHVVSRYPGNGVSGSFNNHLVYLTLSHPTAIWTKFPKSSANSAEQDSEPVMPRLGVLLFSEKDQLGKAVSMSLKDLFDNETSSDTPNPFFPLTELLEGESPQQIVNVIEVPYPLFQNMAPHKSDLPYTSHVRATGINKEAQDYFAIAMSNRLPTGTGTYHAYLVSLDGYTDLLPGGDTTSSKTTPKPEDKLRFVVLDSWSFFTTESDLNFETLATGLNTSFTSPATIQYPFSQVSQNNIGGNGKSTLPDVFGLGYVALKHKMREGVSTVSFYRGPLATQKLPEDEAVFANTEATSADQLLRYNPNTGMFDTSYAVAWQTGQMIALANPHVVAAQWQLNQEVTMKKAVKAQRAFLAQELALEDADTDKHLAPEVRKSAMHWLKAFSEKRKTEL